MSTTAAPTDVICIPDTGSLPDDPYIGLLYHFGMLLGVDDFATEQTYHRAKMRLHSAWLHRAGIVWGLDVDAAEDKREFRVGPGLALDPTGRELHLDVRCCVDIGAWYDQNTDAANATTNADGSVEFDGHIELDFCACATRPVPAISGPCDGANVDTAYSRTFETVSIRFLPGTAEPVPSPYPRLRLLFGLDDGSPPDIPAQDKADILAARTDVLSKAADEQPDALLAYFREFADRDTVAMLPATSADGTTQSVYPGTDDDGVVLANVTGITLAGSTGNWTLTGYTIDRTPRRSHVATQTIEELLCGALLEGSTGGGGSSPLDAGGPRVSAIAVDRPGKQVTITLDKPVAPSTVSHNAFRVSRLEDGGWQPIKVTSADASADGLSIEVDLRVDPGTSLLRFIAFGTGETPLLGADNVPLAGGQNDPPGSADDGHDYVHMST
jgi:hypothetical protein